MTDKFVYTHPKPTPYQNELLTQLIEECSEVIQRATKMQRFGVHEVQKNHPLSNQQRLSMEVGNVFSVVTRIHETTDVLDEAYVENGFAEKNEGLDKYLQNGPGA